MVESEKEKSPTKPNPGKSRPGGNAPQHGVVHQMFHDGIQDQMST